MYITKYNNCFLSELLREFNHSLNLNEYSENNVFLPKVNLKEGEFAFHIEVDLPGMKKEDINIDIQDKKLIISGERKLKKEINEKDYHRVESSYGKFSKSFIIPEKTDIENITAFSENGVLEITIPKLKEIEEEKKLTKIEIK